MCQKRRSKFPGLSSAIPFDDPRFNTKSGVSKPKAASGESGMGDMQEQTNPLFGRYGREFECGWRRQSNITEPCSSRSTSAKGKGHRNARRCWTPCQKLSPITDSFRRRWVVRYLHIMSMKNDRCKQVNAWIHHRQMSAFCDQL